MSRRALLAAASALCAAPAFAAIDPPAAGPHDGRMRVVAYDRSNPVQLYAAPGASVRIQLGADEEVVRVVASDQRLIAPEDEPDPAPSAAQTVAANLGAGALPAAQPKGPASCDANMCRDVMGNFVYLKPLRPLDPQPLFIQTKRCAPNAERCEMVPYAFELLTRPGDAKAAVNAAAWDVRFVYPDRDRAARVAAWRASRQAAAKRAEERASLKPPPPAAPAWGDNWRYGYRGSAAVQPHSVWDDGRTTFLRFSGNVRVPNVYRELPGGKEGTTPYATEADGTGVTVRIAGVGRKWIVRDGDEAGCVFPEPSSLANRSPATVAGVFGGGAR